MPPCVVLSTSLHFLSPPILPSDFLTPSPSPPHPLPPHTFIPSPPHTLTPSYPHTFTPSPLGLVAIAYPPPSYLHPLTPSPGGAGGAPWLGCHGSEGFSRRPVQEVCQLSRQLLSAPSHSHSTPPYASRASTSRWVGRGSGGSGGGGEGREGRRGRVGGGGGWCSHCEWLSM